MAVWAIIQNSVNILLIQRSKHTTRANQWYFSGGGIKINETPEQSCIREEKEETNLSIKIIDTVARIQGDYYFRCQLIDPSESIVLKPDECSNYVWIDPINLINVGIIMNLKAIVPFLRSIGYQINLTEELERYIS